MNFKKAFHILDINEKKTFVVLSLLILISMLLETFGISMIVPLVTILIDGDVVKNYPITEPLINLLGNPSQINLLLYTLFFF